jgi:hypothetical protein
LDAGTTTVTNTDGTITSEVRASPASGFSIVKWTGTGAAGTIGHGLNQNPSLIILKRRDQAGDWYMQHASLGSGKRIQLNQGNAASSSSLWNNTDPTSSVFSVAADNEVNISGGDFLAYVFADVPGHVATGEYTGKTGGVFVPTNFSPQFILVKKHDGLDGGVMWYAARSPRNPALTQVRPNETSGESAEYSSFAFDMYSNGFSPITSSGQVNENGKNFIYLAIGSHPFKIGRAR